MAKYCPHCGTKLENRNFCLECLLEVVPVDSFTPPTGEKIIEEPSASVVLPQPTPLIEPAVEEIADEVFTEEDFFGDVSKPSPLISEPAPISKPKIVTPRGEPYSIYGIKFLPGEEDKALEYIRIKQLYRAIFPLNSFDFTELFIRIVKGYYLNSGPAYEEAFKVFSSVKAKYTTQPSFFNFIFTYLLKSLTIAATNVVSGVAIYHTATELINYLIISKQPQRSRFINNYKLETALFLNRNVFLPEFLSDETKLEALICQRIYELTQDLFVIYKGELHSLGKEKDFIDSLLTPENINLKYYAIKNLEQFARRSPDSFTKANVSDTFMNIYKLQNNDLNPFLSLIQFYLMHHSILPVPDGYPLSSDGDLIGQRVIEFKHRDNKAAGNSLIVLYNLLHIGLFVNTLYQNTLCTYPIGGGLTLSELAKKNFDQFIAHIEEHNSSGIIRFNNHTYFSLFEVAEDIKNSPFGRAISLADSFITKNLQAIFIERNVKYNIDDLQRVIKDYERRNQQ